LITLDQGGRGIEAARIFPPPPDLRPYIEHSWIREGRDPTANSDRAWRIVPDSSPHLIYSRVLRRDSRGLAHHVHRLAVVGPRAVHTDIDMSRRCLTVGVRLRPGSLPLLIRRPASEFVDRSFTAERLFGCRGSEALERAAEASTAGAIQRTLLALFRISLPRRGEIGPRLMQAMELLRCHGAYMSVAKIARQLGVGERTLRLLCNDEIGLPPKRIARVFRLYRSVRLALRERRGGWARIAVTAGYHDQPHLIRDFRALLGETPREFLLRGNQPG
jgi:AraC-like DNA-binding protein